LGQILRAFEILRPTNEASFVQRFFEVWLGWCRNPKLYKKKESENNKTDRKTTVRTTRRQRHVFFN